MAMPAPRKREGAVGRRCRRGQLEGTAGGDSALAKWPFPSLLLPSLLALPLFLLS